MYRHQRGRLMQESNDPLLSVINTRLVLPVRQFCHSPHQKRALAGSSLKQCYLLIFSTTGSKYCEVASIHLQKSFGLVWQKTAKDNVEAFFLCLTELNIIWKIQFALKTKVLLLKNWTLKERQSSTVHTGICAYAHFFSITLLPGSAPRKCLVILVNS